MEGIDVKVEICRKGTSKPVTNEPKAAARQPKPQKLKPPTDRPDVGVVMVKPKKEHDYAEALKSLKANVQVGGDGVELEKISITKSGETRIQVRETREGGRKNFAEKLSQKAEALQAEVKAVSAQVPIAIRGIDDTVDKDEVEEALVKAGVPKEEVENKVNLGEVQAGRAGTRTAVMRVSPSRAFMLLQLQELRVGWSGCRCRITQFEQPQCCFNCQKFGHLAHECKEGKAEGRRCYRCGKEDHIAKDCEASPSCYVCGKNGHRADSRSCPAQREQAAKAQGEGYGRHGGCEAKEAAEAPRQQRCRDAHLLLDNTLVLSDYDIALISEPNRAAVQQASWEVDLEGDAAIWMSRRLQGMAVSRGRGSGYVWVDIGVAVVYSCYVSPNTTDEQFIGFVDSLEESARAWSPRRLLVVTGDFNSAAVEWGSSTTNRRGELILEMTSRLDLLVANDGIVPTFQRREQRSYLDLTLYSGNVNGGIEGWRVLEEETGSDHRYLEFQIRGEREPYLKRVSKGHRRKRRSRYTLRSAAQPDEIREALESYKAAKKMMRRLIQQSRERCWKELCEEVERDAFGKPYKIVMKKIGAATPRLHASLVDRIIERLFPARPAQQWRFGEDEDFNFDEVTAEEVLTAAEKISIGKAPGVDGVPPEVTKMFMKLRPADFAAMTNQLLREGRFPSEWKVARLVLLPKPGKPRDDPSSYRPLCLLDTEGKAVETLLAGRLTTELEQRSAIADTQFGFRAGRSTIDAIQEVVRAAEEERSAEKTWRTRKLCLVILVDVRNAFNSMPWEVVMEALRSAEISPYLRRVIGSYLEDRWIVTTEGARHRMTAGVPQGSILGPTLWNVAYDGVLRLDLPEGASTVAYADDLAIIVKARTEDELVSKANGAMEAVANWMDSKHLALAPEKTEAILLIGRRRCGPLEGLNLRGHAVEPRREVKYLGVWLDRGLTFAPHIQHALTKAKKSVKALSRILPRTRGAGEGRRRLLATVATSIATYGAPVWEKALRKERNVRRLASVQRQMALRICRAYRTAGLSAVLALSRQVPWHLVVTERKLRHEDRREPDPERRRTKKQRWEETLSKWQEEWTEDTGESEWTKKLVPDLREWQTRRHGQTSYHLTQALTGHGCFQEYLYRFRKTDSPECLLCLSGSVDGVRHTLMECEFFDREREEFRDALDWGFKLEGMVEKMLEGSEEWNAVDDYVSRVIGTKEALERVRKRATEESEREEMAPAQGDGVAPEPGWREGSTGGMTTPDRDEAGDVTLNTQRSANMDR
ncbi:uncharacterized protein LOC114828103 [Galendromus occidentalis]|uniref:Uncharacterized protein LOC114828103 n=1 Tax=Galendromus occidentalis TaxID=34638 RepID=A0AAJ7SER8_9ACAR|nr:uncharacterized protein LOC114828103 [Galendromus occidentalis]